PMATWAKPWKIIRAVVLVQFIPGWAIAIAMPTIANEMISVVARVSNTAQRADCSKNAIDNQAALTSSPKDAIANRIALRREPAESLAASRPVATSITWISSNKSLNTNALLSGVKLA